MENCRNRISDLKKTSTNVTITVERSDLKTHHARDKIEKELKLEGWVKQFTIDEPRLSEAELYKSLGYEVRLEKAEFNKDNETCRACFLDECSNCKTIYIRQKNSAQK